MDSILIIGIIIFTGFVAGEICTRIGLPKVTGYILGIINYSFAISIAGICIQHQSMGVYSIAQPFIKVLGSIIGGCLFGFCLNSLTKVINRKLKVESFSQVSCFPYCF